MYLYYTYKLNIYKGSIPGLERSPGEGQGYPLQYSALENSMDYPWGPKESDTTEQLYFRFQVYICIYIHCLTYVIWAWTGKVYKTLTIDAPVSPQNFIILTGNIPLSQKELKYQWQASGYIWNSSATWKADSSTHLLPHLKTVLRTCKSFGVPSIYTWGNGAVR